jgi:hypothetical protein
MIPDITLDMVERAFFRVRRLVWEGSIAKPWDPFTIDPLRGSTGTIAGNTLLCLSG